MLRSKTLVKEVVNYLNLYVTYKDEDLIPSKELYKTSPVQVNMTPQEAEKLKKDIVVEMVVQPQGSLDVNVKMDDREIQKRCLPFFLLTGERFLSFRLLILSLWRGLLQFRAHGISQLPLAVP